VPDLGSDALRACISRWVPLVSPLALLRVWVRRMTMPLKRARTAFADKGVKKSWGTTVGKRQPRQEKSGGYDRFSLQNPLGQTNTG